MRHRLRKIVLALGLSAAGLAALPTEPPSGRSPATVAERIGREPFRVVVIVLDTLRRDRLAFYGNPKQKAPFLSRLAAEGAVFERAYATSSWTSTSMASVFTGLYPDQHHVLTGYNVVKIAQARDQPLQLNRIPETAGTLPEVAKAAGFATFGVSTNWNIDSVMGFARGFDAFVRASDRTAEAVNQQATAWRNRLAAEPAYFLYLHYLDMHDPYRRHDRWFDASEADRRLARYDSSLGYLDSKLQELFDSLGWSERTLIVVLADHGEEFGDHGRRGHGVQLYDELVNIPMLLWWPGVIEPRRVTTPVSQVDLLPTLATLMSRGRTTADGDGVSLLPLLDGGSLPDRTLFAKRVDERRAPHVVLWAAVRGRWKLIQTSPGNVAELYDLEQDPRETQNLAETHPEVVAELRRGIAALDGRPKFHARTYAQSEKTASELNELERELRSLGYVQ